MTRPVIAPVGPSGIVRAMKRYFWACVMFLLGSMAVAAPAALEAEVGQAIQSKRITIVHFWAPWCPNCKMELTNGGWSSFIAANPNVDFVFLTIWSDQSGDGRTLLAQNGVKPQGNVRLLAHPNPSRKSDDRVNTFLGLPLTWLPATWVFREGKLLYLVNYGELRFPMLQQLVRDAGESWDRD
jgi:thiol-disulfide isomerase/thioredoxin